MARSNVSPTPQHLVSLLQELLQLAQQQAWDTFIAKSGEMRGLDFRIHIATELSDDDAEQMRKDVLLAQQLLLQVTQLAQQERQELADQLALLSNQTKLGAAYGH